MAIALVAIGLAATGAHTLIVIGYHGPSVFDDELGYEKLAQSLGLHGDLALFGKRGLSYSPLYPLLLAPLFALHLSAVSAYEWAKIVNSLVMAISVFPTYKIARFVLTPARAVLAALLSAFAPLMLYSSLEMSENLAYPIALFAFWAMLVSIRSPGVRHDAVVLVLCLLATATRLQFVVLLPAAFTAALVAGVVDARRRGSVWSRVRGALGQHALLTAATAALALIALAAVAGTSALSLAGRYSNQRGLPAPSPWLIAKIAVQNLAGLVFAVGVIPFAGALVATVVWGRRWGKPATRAISPFAILSLSVTAFVVVMTAFASYGQSYVPGSAPGDLPRIHERYMFYVLPLFVIALIATTAIPRSDAMLRIGIGAALVTGLLPLAIPWHSIMNDTVVADTFGLTPFAAVAPNHGIQAQAHAALVGFGFALLLAVIYALARPNVVIVSVLLVAVFIGTSVVVQHFLNIAAVSATHTTVSSNRNWVDSVRPRGSVVIVQDAHRTTRHSLAFQQTAFYDLSISHLYYTCVPLLSSDFGEIRVALDRAGRLRAGNALVRAPYVVAASDAGIVGRVVAVNAPAQLVLVKPADGIVRVAAGGRDQWRCRARAG